MAQSNFRQGTIELHLTKPHLMCREAVNGSVTINLQDDFPSGQMVVELVGRETTCTFEQSKLERINQKERKWQSRKQVFMYSRKVIKSPVADKFTRGKHTFEFELKLTSADKPTFHHSCQSLKHPINANCQYHIRVSLKTPTLLLKAKKEVVVYSNDRPIPDTPTAKARFELTGLKGMFRTKSTSLEIDSLQPYLDMEAENPILLNIDTSKSYASPLNVRLALVNIVLVKSGDQLYSCHNLVWSGLLTSKLEKGTNYSNNVGFIMTIPRENLGQFYQTFSNSHVINRFVLRFSYQTSLDSNDQNSVLLPVQFYRSILPSRVVTSTCTGQVKLSAIQLKDIDALFIDPKTKAFRGVGVPQSDQKEVDRDTKESVTEHEKVVFRTNPQSNQQSFRPLTSDPGPNIPFSLRSKSCYANQNLRVLSQRRILGTDKLEISKRISTN